ncbi:tagaturonate reductase [Aquimarina algiphila]|uniref:tagaturonate reductase n=1 Tax=Aquimarina algiphila TaxID=2047982 RepID=UPI002492CAC4|nr:tagaturonate reductase [Aquimarina algiphila]
MKPLNRTTSSTTLKAPERIMQFGGGNFLRAFADWIIDVLNKETDFNGSIVIIKPTEKGDYTALKEQDGLFHVAIDGVRKDTLVSEVTLVKSISRVIQPYTHWNEYLSLAEDPEMRFIISNTTEAGIKFSESDTFQDAPPKEFPAKLTIWLYHRFQHFEGAIDKGCIILPCELIEQNGDTLRAAVLQYAAHWNLGTKFTSWIKESNYFYNTLVDRIVSGYPKERSKTILEKIGYEDSLLVAGEDYHSWVIQGNQIIQKELPFEHTSLNVKFVDDIKTYREMKVRILNGAHTSMVPVGYLSGLRTVKEVMDDPLTNQFVSEILSEEITKTLQDFSTSELNDFVNTTLDRFRNPTLKHFLISISLNSTSKFVSRLLPALKEYTVTYNELPKRIVFALSCVFRFYQGVYDGETIPLNDDPVALASFKKQWKLHLTETITYQQMVSFLLRDIAIWGENLDAINGLSEAVTENLRAIEQHGVRSVIKQITDHKFLV